LGVALNKMGATAYLAAAAGFIAMLINPSHFPSVVPWILLFSIVTPIFAAGVPFAAVFALGLVLQYTTILSGPAWWVMSIEPLLDPIVTMVNVIGNLVASVWFVQGPLPYHISIEQDPANGAATPSKSMCATAG
jgi:Na+/H+-dicarboxylate symporter